MVPVPSQLGVRSFWRGDELPSKQEEDILKDGHDWRGHFHEQQYTAMTGLVN